ncbi:extracellular solute-binding protein [Promicromonospora sp. Populi]|uniref:extracellular solute-binding protein n=1 Tax=Promicromonospora sp. Populi TaxID=3239420 RepID=UPI0034E1ABFF
MTGSLFPDPHITRRNLLVGGLGLGAFAVLGLAGCSNEGRGGGALASNAGVALPTYIPYDGVPIDIVGADGVPNTMLKYPANPQQVTDGPPGDGQDVGVLALTNTPAPPGVDRNEYWQALNERLGFSLAVSQVLAGDFTDRFQTAVAGDQLPDLFTYFPVEVPGLPGLLAERATDLTELLSGDAVSRYPFLANIPTQSWQSSVYGGKIYGVPIPRGPMSSTVMYTRQDVLDAEGLSAEVGSLDDFVSLCTELTGANRWALGKAPITYLREMFALPNVWAEEGGSLTSVNEHERQAEALEACRRLVADGVVHPDAFAVEGPQRKTWMVNRTVTLLDDTFSAWTDFFNYPIDDEFRLAVIPPPLAEGGGPGNFWLAGATHNLTSISARSADRAEALLDVLNYLAAPFGSAEHLFKNYGLEGVHHTLEGTDPVLTEKGRTEAQLSLKYMAEGPWVNYQAGLPEVAQDQYDAQTGVVPTALRNPVEGLFSETGSRRGAQINTALLAVENDIISGREPVSAWTTAVDAWKRGGGDTIRDEYQEALTARES